MPNWCQNILEITGKEVELESFIEKAEDGKFSLQTYHPMPTLPSEKKGVIPNWYDWRIEHWGTKWDVSERGGLFLKSTEEGETPVTSTTMMIENGQVCLSFLTAWSPPAEGIAKISEDWPELVFVLRYAEAGLDFAGSITLQNGEVLIERESTFDEYTEMYDFNRAF